jgi:hypothetical protein
LLPGDYFLIAIDDQFSDGWLDPKRLATFAPLATRVTIALGQHAGMDLRTETVK